MTRPTQDTPQRRRRFRVQDCHLVSFCLSKQIPLSFRLITPIEKSYNPGPKMGPVWALPLSLAATYGIDFSFCSSGYLDVSVLRVDSLQLCIHCRTVRGSPGQSLFNGSPKLFAVFHALQSLLMPRHPPCALYSLIAIIHYFEPSQFAIQ